MDASDIEGELERLHDASWGWALACCGRDRDVAEEALQSAYARVLSGQARFDGKSQFRTWLFGVIRYAALEEARRTRRWWSRSAPVEGADKVAASEPVEEAGSPELAQAMAALSPRQGEVLHLVFYQDLTIEEAARVMNISIGSARTHYERGKSALRAKLGGRR